MHNTKISVIVPVYNVERYIHECIDSILNQTFKEFELILIDNGSIDNSGKICDDYGKRDNRIKVIHTENVGVSVARNIGLKAAIGEYIMFIDSDDYIEKCTLMNSYSIAQMYNADIVMFALKLIYEHSNNKDEVVSYNKYDDIEIYSNKEVIKKYLTHEIRGYVWNRLVKREILIRNNIVFPIGVGYGEDIFVTLETISAAQKVVLMNEAMYNYRQRKDSMSKIISEKNIK